MGVFRKPRFSKDDVEKAMEGFFNRLQNSLADWTSSCGPNYATDSESGWDLFGGHATEFASAGRPLYSSIGSSGLSLTDLNLALLFAC